MVLITIVTITYGTYNELVTGAFVNQLTYNWGAHIVGLFKGYNHQTSNII